jgi:tripartite-type tricarboxylate transporter receptor subunit TctC
MMRTFHGLTLALALTSAALAPQAANAQTFPNKPITMVVPYGAGGGTDVLARAVSEELSKALGQPVIVDTRPGANGAIGAGIVAKAPADGYTLLFAGSSVFSLNPNLMKELPYDQLNDFTPVANIGGSPYMLVVPADSPYKTVDDVIKAAKAEPGKLTYGHWQSFVLVTGEAFARATGIELRKVPYKGAVEAQNDFLGGRLNILFTDTLGAKGYAEAGKLRILAVTTLERSVVLKDIPTLTELGYKVNAEPLIAVFAPSKTPKAVQDKLHAEITKVISTSASVREKMLAIGIEPKPMTQAAVDDLVKSELPRWADMIAKAGLQKE